MNKKKKKERINKVLILYIVFITSLSFAQSPALDNYVAMEDTSFSFYAADTIYGDNYTTYIMYMSSQIWRDTSEVDRVLWEHWAGIIVPDNVYYDKALLFIGGGSNNPNPPSGIADEFALIATLTNSVVIDFGMVPNEPLTFSDESESRTEDEIIAYSWEKYLNGGDDTWILQLPMVKSVVRGMDMVQEFTSGLDNPLTINQFVLSGASKRGWTTWLTSAVDERVCATIPIVFDALNLVQSFRHHYGAYGFWSEAVEDYEDMGIFDWFSYPEIYDLMAVVDPLEYKNRLTMPKFLIHATGDEFFVPSSQFYFDEPLGPTFQRYVPNAGHGLDSAIEDVVYTLVAFYKAILNDSNLPELSWNIQDDGSIHYESITIPNQVKLWQAVNENAFDFRYPIIGAACNSSILTDQGNGIYIGEVDTPDSGWTAFFIEVIYPTGGQFSHKFTTDVSFLPITLPHAADIIFTAHTNLSSYNEMFLIGQMTSGLYNEMAQDTITGFWTLTIPVVMDGDYTWDLIGVTNNDTTFINDTPISFSVLDGQVFGETDFVHMGINNVNQPETFSVQHAFPNPFNPTITLNYELPFESSVGISIYDIRGREIYHETTSKFIGKHQFIWDGKNIFGMKVSSGVYLLRISTQYSYHIQKMVLLE